VRPEPTPLWPAIGTAVFVVLAPGTVVGLVPFWITRWRLMPPFLACEASRWLGALLFVLALPLFTSFVLRFVREGRGTPAPIAPTERLVVGGPFRYVRNPGYVAVLALLVGQALFFGSGAVLVYATFVGLAFHVFVILYEEPTLRRQFGAEYEDYCRRVPRWVPRLRLTP
jgi:protein-S-isoprenylcysteine O-methyltransferase Ste14